MEQTMHRKGQETTDLFLWSMRRPIRIQLVDTHQQTQFSATKIPSTALESHEHICVLIVWNESYYHDFLMKIHFEDNSAIYSLSCVISTTPFTKTSQEQPQEKCIAPSNPPSSESLLRASIFLLKLGYLTILNQIYIFIILYPYPAKTHCFQLRKFLSSWALSWRLPKKRVWGEALWPKKETYCMNDAQSPESKMSLFYLHL